MKRRYAIVSPVFFRNICMTMSIIFSAAVHAAYLDSASCKECHKDIYKEHAASMHANSSLFKDEIHRKMKEKTSKDKYACALCHMPSSPDLALMIRGGAQPDEKDIRQTDGVSCHYCHQINNIHRTKAFNINILNSTNGDKPTFFGNLQDSDSSDKHHSKSNEIFKNSEVCMGCHSHKENQYGIQVCNTLNQYDKTSNCIGCHMPKEDGGVENLNKKSRKIYATHSFHGIRSEKMISKAVELKLAYEGSKIKLTIQNKMGHSIITQPMRLKFVKTTLSRDGKVIWSNFTETPLEDKEATFIVVFKDDKEQPSMPDDARGFKINQNLKANESKTVVYTPVSVKKGDVVSSVWVSYLVNPDIAKKLDIEDKKVIQPIYGSKAEMVIR